MLQWLLFFAPIASATTLVNELLKFREMGKCSASFAAVVSVAVNEYTSDKTKEGFSNIFAKWISANSQEVESAFGPLSSTIFKELPSKPTFPSDERSCFPLESNVAKFFNMNQIAASEIAAAVVYLRRKRKRDSVTELTTVAGAIASKLSTDQLQVAFVMADIASSMKEFKGKVCSHGKIIEKIPEMSSNFEENYFPTVFGFLRAAKLCGERPEDLNSGLLQRSSRDILKRIQDILASSESPLPLEQKSGLLTQLTTGFNECAARSFPTVKRGDASSDDIAILGRFGIASLETVSRLQIPNVHVPVFETSSATRTIDDLGIHIVGNKDGDCAMISVVTTKYTVKVMFSSDGLHDGTWTCPVSVMGESQSFPADSDLFRLLNQETEQSVFSACWYFAQRMVISDPEVACSNKFKQISELGFAEMPNCPWKDSRLQIRSVLVLVTPPGPLSLTAIVDPELRMSATPREATSPLRSPLSLTSNTFIASSIANQEKIFFTNFHDAAQQLSLLGIKAVGLATQIQAIRGHIMMLQLIDSHIAQLGADHERYTKLLTQAHDQLATVTGR